MNITTSLKRKTQVVSEHPFARVLIDKSTGQKSLHATLPFSPGDVIHSFSAASTLSYPTRMTVQTDETEHIILEPEFLQYMNHSCDPNVFFNTTTMELECLQPIKAGDELTFFYPSTEWDMASPFTCQCGSPDCLQVINGASHIPLHILEKYKLTDFIRRMVRQKYPV